MSGDLEEFVRNMKAFRRPTIEKIFASSAEQIDLNVKTTEFVQRIEYKMNEFSQSSVDSRSDINILHKIKQQSLEKHKVIETDLENIKLSKELEQLKAKRSSLQMTLEKFESENREKLKLYATIVKDYSTAFNLKINILKCDGDIYELEMNFLINNEPTNLPITMSINLETKQLIDLNASSFCSPDEERMLLDYGMRTTNNLPGFMCKLRSHLIQHLDNSR